MKTTDAEVKVKEVWHVTLTPYADSSVSWVASQVFGLVKIEQLRPRPLDAAIIDATNAIKQHGGKFVSHWFVKGPYQV